MVLPPGATAWGCQHPLLLVQGLEGPDWDGCVPGGGNYKTNRPQFRPGPSARWCELTFSPDAGGTGGRGGCVTHTGHARRSSLMWVSPFLHICLRCRHLYSQGNGSRDCLWPQSLHP